QCQMCKEAIGRWRCKDCQGRPLICRGCCRWSHRRTPFHRIERWTGKFFQKAALWEVAVIAGFLPSSFKDIKTLFTTSCLDDFRLANLECKTSAYQYYQMLRRRTNPSNPTAVPDRYAELRRASREWRHLKKLKQSGSGHSHVAPGTGDFTVFCPACPQEGIIAVFRIVGERGFCSHTQILGNSDPACRERSV
ncbi:hypothetical protein GALMADRAFT_80367, partial [Galerina marginata CBS 339.88]